MPFVQTLTIVRRPSLEWLIHVARRCRAVARKIRSRLETRRALASMSARDARDIGLTMSELETACNRPIWQDPTAGLDQAARERSGNW